MCNKIILIYKHTPISIVLVIYYFRLSAVALRVARTTPVSACLSKVRQNLLQ